jgi:molecular chaperone DnaJ
VHGAEVDVEMNKRVICNACRGTRAEPDSSPRKCFECGGRGSYIGNYGIKKRCVKCNGAGCTPKTFCKSCEGLGVQRQILTEKVKLPGGVVNGQKIKVPLLGHAADVFTSVPGDLLLTVEVSPHDVFKVDDKNIKSTVELTLSEAILGCVITVMTAHGP